MIILTGKAGAFGSYWYLRVALHNTVATMFYEAMKVVLVISMYIYELV